MLKQNSALLKQLADVESEHEQVVYDLTKTAAEQAATSAGAENKDRKIAELEAKVRVLPTPVYHFASFSTLFDRIHNATGAA